MGTVEPRGRRRARLIAPALMVAVALGVGVWSANRPAPPPDPSTTTPPVAGAASTAAPATTPASAEPVAVAATDAVTYETVGALAAASDLVVRGRVAEVRRGRVVGEPGAAIESRIVSISVTAVLRGEQGATDRILLEEEGWLDDGTPIAVNGVSPLTVGDEAVWFLRAVTDPELRAYVAVSSQARFQVLPDGRLRGSAPADPLVRATEAAGLAPLLALVAD